MKMLIKLLIRLSRSQKLKQEDRALILNYLLESVQALPIQELINYNLEGTIEIRGKALTVEQKVQLREGAVGLKKNWTYRTIKEQLAFEAIKMGVHSSLTLDMVLLSKAILWIQEKEKELIIKLSGQEETLDN